MLILISPAANTLKHLVETALAALICVDYLGCAVFCQRLLPALMQKSASSVIDTRPRALLHKSCEGFIS